MRMKTGLKYLLLQKVVKKQINYLMGFQQAELLKCLLVIAHGVLILPCLETNSVLNGWWSLNQIERNKSGSTSRLKPVLWWKFLNNGFPNIHQFNCKRIRITLSHLLRLKRDGGK